MRKNLKEVLLQIIGFLLAKCMLLSGNPVGIGYFAAMFEKNKKRMVSFTVTLLGIALASGSVVTVIKYSMLMLTIVFLFRMREEGKRYTALMVTGIDFMFELLGAFMENTGILWRGVAEAFFMAILCGASMVVFGKAIEQFDEGKLNYTKILVTMLFVTTEYALGYVCGMTGISDTHIYGMLIGSVVFVFLPETLNDVLGVGDDIASREHFIKQAGENRLFQIEESFNRLADSLSLIPRKKELSDGDLERIYFEMHSKLCKNCIKRKSCASRDDIQCEIKEMVSMADAKGKLSLQDMSGRFMMNCMSPEVFIGELNHIFEKERINMVWGNKLIESREVISLQLRQIANMVGEYGKMLYNTFDCGDDIEEKLRQGLREEKIILKRFAMLENSDNRKEYLMTAKCQRGRAVNAKEIAGLIKDITGLKLEPSVNGRKILGNDYATMAFSEKKNFYVLHGTARCTKNESELSGDNFTFLEIGNNQVLMSIADGMGSGYYAFQDSETAIELLEQLMDTGFSEEVALKMINSVMLLGNDMEKPTTLDMGILNLMSGVCDFVKFGAAATFVKRSRWVEAIKSTNMPIGMMGQVDIESVSKKMYSGDMIIMVSDGVVEAIDAEDKDKVISDIIMNIDSTNPKEIASKVLENVLECSNYKADDDMTVLVTGIWNRVA